MTHRFGATKPTAPSRRSTGCTSKMWDASIESVASTRTKAWTAFWQEQGADSRCLANAAPDLRSALDAHWSAFAATLAAGTRIVDIGCGGGAVGRALLATRDDLCISGIDLARVPASSDPRLSLLAETAMERLPFADESIDAAVSQFGFEYGRIGQAAGELARVLVPGGPFSFVVHHSSSTIVRQSRSRNRALRALLREEVRRPFLAGDEAELDRQLWAVRHTAPTDLLIGHAVRALRDRLGRGEAQRAAIWTGVAEALAPEHETLDALESACVTPAGLDEWLACFAGRFAIRTASPIHRSMGEVIAWKIDGLRSGGGRTGAFAGGSPGVSRG